MESMRAPEVAGGYKMWKTMSQEKVASEARCNTSQSFKTSLPALMEMAVFKTNERPTPIVFGAYKY